MNQLLEQLRAAVAPYRFTFGTELEMQNQLAEVFRGAGIAFEREFQLSLRDRPDFFIDGFAIETKLGGSINGHLRQIKRYNDHPKVMGTILISTRPFLLPETLSGKPVAGLSVGANRL